MKKIFCVIATMFTFACSKAPEPQYVQQPVQQQQQYQQPVQQYQQPQVIQDSGPGVGTAIAAGVVGAAGGYFAGKAMANKAQQQNQQPVTSYQNAPQVQAPYYQQAQARPTPSVPTAQSPQVFKPIAARSMNTVTTPKITSRPASSSFKPSAVSRR